MLPFRHSTYVKEARLVASNALSIGAQSCLRGVLLIVMLSLVTGCSQTPTHQESAPTPAAKAAVVDLTVDDSGGHVKHFTLPFQSGMTVLDVMNEAHNNANGIQLVYHPTSGNPATFFLDSIDGVANQGGGAKSRNWIYRVNSKLGDRSFGVCKVAASVQISWKFDIYDPNEQASPGACQ